MLFDGELGVNASDPWAWAQRADVFVGQRYGAFMFYFVPACVVNGMLCAHSALLTLWETTFARQDRAAREARYPTSMAVLGYFHAAALVVWAVAAGLAAGGGALTFGVDGGAFPRPVCDDGEGWRGDGSGVAVGGGDEDSDGGIPATVQVWQEPWAITPRPARAEHTRRTRRGL